MSETIDDINSLVDKILTDLPDEVRTHDRLLEMAYLMQRLAVQLRSVEEKADDAWRRALNAGSSELP